MKEKDMKKFFVIQYIIIGLLVLLCLFLFIDRISDSDKNNNSTQTLNDYDISKMNELDINEALAMFNDNKQHVLYIGRETCVVCKSLLPNLQKAQDDLDYTTQYLDITKVDRNSDEWQKFEKLLDIETNINVTNKDGEKELKTESYGYFVGTYGYTPTVIIINKNKMVAGHIGNFSLDDLKTWLQSNGIG